MTWDDFLDLVATILIAWMALAVVGGIVADRYGRRHDEEE